MQFPTITIEIGFKDPYGGNNLYFNRTPYYVVDPEVIKQENLELWERACAKYGQLYPYPSYYLPERK